MLAKLVTDRLMGRTVMGNNVIWALSPAGVRLRMPNITLPALVVIASSVEISPPIKPSFDYQGLYMMRRNITIMALFKPDVGVNTEVGGSLAEQLEFELMAQLFNWQPTDSYHAMSYTGFQVKEDSNGSAWIDYGFEACLSFNAECFVKPDPTDRLDTMFATMHGLRSDLNVEPRDC